MTTSAGTPIDPQFHIIDGLSIRFAQSQGRHDDALALRSCNSDRQWVAIGFAAAPVVGGDAAGASTGWDAT